MSDKLNQAIATIKAGDKQTGRQLLIEILKTEPQNENAWLWMTQVLTKREDKIKCLEKALEINPNNEVVQNGLRKLRPAEPVTPIVQRKKRERTESTIRRLERTKKCPYCAETIKVEAKVCRFCGRDLKEQIDEPVKSTQQPPKKKRKSRVPFLLFLILFTCVGIICIGNLINSPSSTPSKSAAPGPTSDMRFTITRNSLGSKNALAKEITSKGWKFKEVETMPDGTRCDTYNGSNVVFGLCAEGDELKAIVIQGDEFADFNPVFAIASMYDIRYYGDFKDAVTDTWFDLSLGESTVLDLDTDGVIMTIQRTYDDGYGITYILESHLP